MLNEICRVLKPNGQIWFTLDAMENMQKHDISKSSASLPNDRYSMEYCLFDNEKIQEMIMPIMDVKNIFKTTYINPQTMDTFMTKYGILGVCKK